MNENEITDLARQIRLETLKSLTQLGLSLIHISEPTRP